MELLLIDADGTFLEPDGTARKETTDALKRAQTAGAKVLLATGRLKAEITGPLHDFPFDGYILGAGAYVELEGQLLKEQCLTEDQIQTLADFLAAYPIPCIWESNAGLFCNSLSKKVLDKLGSAYPKALNHIIESVQVTETPWCDHPVKISFFENPWDHELVLSRLGSSFDVVKATFEPFFNGGGEIMVKNLSKGAAVDLLKEVAGPCHVTAIGDGSNDIAMFEHADASYCMGNGSEDAKKSADVIAPAQNDNGVSWIIDQLLG